MGEAVQIPFLDISREEGSEGWKALCTKVREICEMHGCFLIKYDKVPKSLHEDMSMAMKTLFDLPEETKKKYKDPRPYNSYENNYPKAPLLECFGIDDATMLDSAQAFTNLLWPEGNPNFSGVFNSMNSKMLELSFINLKMILEGFSMGKYYDMYAENSRSSCRVMKYNVPPSNDSATGLLGHTDKSFLTILYQNEVHGLEVLSKEGNWIQVVVPEGSFVVLVGDVLKAWSNGRLHAAKHRVVMSGNKERYSCGLFLVPKDELKIEVPRELVDKERPLKYRPFTYPEFLSYYFANMTSDDALETYAGA
ncbi:hypothetical protein L1049_018936 [Liquidambar formosana]|uniref:2-oxoglutarate-dependent dioxygenase DAO n=1 Tax=Liquidambar formosana TaxID=63359 RepID=A0AAP0RAS8_LIQFO